MSFMTNWELENQAHARKLPLNGIYNKDLLPTVAKPGFYIINLQDDLDMHGNDLPGSHWTCIYVEGKQAVYFDSFGFAPPIEVQNFLRRYVPYKYNTQVIQSMRSGVCGQYVLFFMVFMRKHASQMYNLNRRFDAFLRLWSPKVTDNRTKLLDYLKKYS